MRRAGRILFTILSALALLLFIASFALRSYCREHSTMLWCGERKVVVVGLGTDGNAIVAFSWIPADWTPAAVRSRWFYIWRWRGTTPIDRWIVPDLQYTLWKRQEVFKRTTVFLFPFWRVQLACGALSLVWIVTFVRKRRLSRVPGLCKSCGYDLRASPERCPECGTAKPAAV